MPDSRDHTVFSIRTSVSFSVPPPQSITPADFCGVITSLAIDSASICRTFGGTHDCYRARMPDMRSAYLKAKFLCPRHFV